MVSNKSSTSTSIRCAPNNKQLRLDFCIFYLAPFITAYCAAHARYHVTAFTQSLIVVLLLFLLLLVTLIPITDTDTPRISQVALVTLTRCPAILLLVCSGLHSVTLSPPSNLPAWQCSSFYVLTSATTTARAASDPVLYATSKKICSD